MPADEIDLHNPRWQLATRLGDIIRTRWSAEVRAIGVQGSLAHGDDTESSDVNLVVLTYRRPGAGPRPVRRRVDGTMVDLDVLTADDAELRVREIGPEWPLVADRWLSTRELFDPRGHFGKLRDTHLARLAQARPADFTGPAHRNWCRAAAAHDRAVRLAEWYETDAALLLLAEARLHAALVAGLLSRTHFRGRADAVKRAGLAGADMTELAAVLAKQADDLTARGRPVDGPLNTLWE